MIKAQNLSLQKNPTNNVFSKLLMHNSLGFLKEGYSTSMEYGRWDGFAIDLLQFEPYLQVLKGRNDIHTLIQIKHDQYV